jgi:hypothetical protein
VKITHVPAGHLLIEITDRQDGSLYTHTIAPTPGYEPATWDLLQAAHAWTLTQDPEGFHISVQDWDAIHDVLTTHSVLVVETGFDLDILLALGTRIQRTVIEHYTTAPEH